MVSAMHRPKEQNPSSQSRSSRQSRQKLSPSGLTLQRLHGPTSRRHTSSELQRTPPASRTLQVKPRPHSRLPSGLTALRQSVAPQNNGSHKPRLHWVKLL